MDCTGALSKEEEVLISPLPPVAPFCLFLQSRKNRSMQNARMQMLPVNIDAAGPDARVRSVQVVAVRYASFHC